MKNSIDSNGINFRLSEMDFDEYKCRFHALIASGDVRERMFQEFLIRPFLESLTSYDVIPTDIKLRKNIHDYSKYSGKTKPSKRHKNGTINTPDLCIAKEWKWNNIKTDKSNYVATVEIKSPAIDPISRYQRENASNYNDIKPKIEIRQDNTLVRPKGCSIKLYNEMSAHLSAMDHVILTDGVDWFLFCKTEENNLSITHHSLGYRVVGYSTTDNDTKKRLKTKGYVWDKKSESQFEKLKEKLKNFFIPTTF